MDLDFLFIRAIHFIIVGIVFLTPFFGTFEMVLINMFFIVGIMFHWYMNNDMCALTLVESKLRGLPMTETFFGRIFGPVYSVGVESTFCWTLLVILLLVSIWRIRVLFPGIFEFGG